MTEHDEQTDDNVPAGAAATLHYRSAALTHRRPGRRVIVCVSPKAGSGEGRCLLPQLVQQLDQAGLEVMLSDDIRAVRAACQGGDGADGDPPLAVVAAGGDGTLALVADAVPATIPLVPYPLGTENLLARYYGYCTDPRRTAATVCGGSLHRIDAGRAGRRMFLVMASCGFDAEVVRAMHLTRRGHIQRISYAKPILRAVRTYRYPPIQVRWADGTGIVGTGITVAPPAAAELPASEVLLDPLAAALPDPELPDVPLPDAPLSDAPLSDAPLSAAPPADACWSPPVTCRWAMLFNLPSYGAGLRIEPDALDDDGLLDFFGLPLGSTWTTLRYVGGVIAGYHRRWPDVLRGRAQRWHLSSEQRVPYQLDGDYAGRLPVEIEILPQRVTLRLPLDRSRVPRTPNPSFGTNP